MVGCSGDKKSKDPVQRFKDDVVAKLNDPKITEAENLYWLEPSQKWSIDVVETDSLVTPYKATATLGDLTFYFKFEDDEWVATGMAIEGAEGDFGPDRGGPSTDGLNAFLRKK